MRPLFVIVLLALATTVAYAQCAPKDTVRMVIANVSPGVDKASFAAVPKTIYRLGTGFARIEEQPNPETGLHGLIVVSHRDSWIVNLMKGTGTHVVDHDENSSVHAPIFPVDLGDSFPDALRGLEYGCEVAFYDEHQSPVTKFRSQEVKMVKQVLGAGEWNSVLVRSHEKAPPSGIFLFRNEELVFAVKYLSYEVVPGDTTRLFEKPSDIAYTDAAP